MGTSWPTHRYDSSVKSKLSKIFADNMNIFDWRNRFIGSNFLRQALAAGHFVYATRRSLTNASLTDERRLHWLHRQHEVTVEDLQGCDVLVHEKLRLSICWTISGFLHWNLLEVLNL